MIAILHDIRSIYNVASIFRTADGLGIEKLYLSGYTPAPTDRFGRKRKKFSKVALGAEKSVDFEKVNDINRQLKELQADGIQVAACEPTPEANDYRKVPLHQDTCLVFGNEPDGLPDAVTAACDKVVEIPMQGQKSSLNVAVAFGVFAAYFVDGNF